MKWYINITYSCHMIDNIKHLKYDININGKCIYNYICYILSKNNKIGSEFIPNDALINLMPKNFIRNYDEQSSIYINKYFSFFSVIERIQEDYNIDNIEVNDIHHIGLNFNIFFTITISEKLYDQKLIIIKKNCILKTNFNKISNEYICCDDSKKINEVYYIVEEYDKINYHKYDKQIDKIQIDNPINDPFAKLEYMSMYILNLENTIKELNHEIIQLKSKTTLL